MQASRRSARKGYARAAWVASVTAVSRRGGPYRRPDAGGAAPQAGGDHGQSRQE
jgi:hypothetical protein